MARRFEAMPCADARERLEAYVDGELAPAHAAEVEAHLEGCTACVAEHRLAKAVRRELRALPELDAPPAVLREVRMAAARTRFRRSAPSRRRSWAALAAAMLATAVLGASLWWRSVHPAPPAGPAAIDAAAIAQATEEARYALAYLTRVNRRAGLKLRDDLFGDRVARPAARGLSRSLSPHLTTGTAGSVAGGQDRS